MKTARPIVAAVAILFVSIGLQGLAFRGFAPIDLGPAPRLPYTGTIPLHDALHLLAGVLLLKGSGGRRNARMGAAVLGGVVLAASALPMISVGPVGLGTAHVVLYSIAAITLGMAALVDGDGSPQAYAPDE